jgi:hypothetical protein
MGEQVRQFYLRKKTDYLKAEQKMRKVIQQHPQLQEMFFDLEDLQEAVEAAPSLTKSESESSER